MDVSDNSQMDLNEIVFETKLESRNIISIFQSILFKYNTNWRLFFFIEQNKLTYGTLPYLTKKMERQINITETHIKKESQEHIVKCYAEQRQVLIVVLSGDAILVTDSELLNILLNKIKRNIADGKQLKRHMDTDIFLATFFLYQMNHDTKDNASKISGKQHPQNTPLAANKNYTKRNDNVSISAPSKLRPLTPRRPHSTTFIEPDKRDIFDDDISVTMIPNDKNVFKNKLHSPDSRHLTEVDKFPIQAVEIDAGMLSFEPYPGQTYTIPSATRESEPGQRSFSNPGDSNTLSRQATVQRSMVTSGSGIPFHLKPSRYADYQDQKKRYDSFQTPKWLTDSKPNINLLVGCGFFFTGNNDLVRCYHCGIGLKDWIKDDDPLAEHVKYSSTCDFLIWRYGKPKVERMKAALTTESSSERESRPPPPSYPIRSPRYQTMEERLASFENFPRANNIPHQQLAVAGLFFTGQSDLCRCFTCDGGLKDWSPGDDPIKEHATYFSNCHYINKLKGHEYVQLQQQSRSSNEAAMGAEGGNNTPHQATEASPNIPIERMSLQDSNLDMSQVVQNLGYSEMDFILAKSEIEKKKGRVVITVEEIINTLLDMKDRAKQLKAGATSTQENKTDLKSMVEENKKLTRLMYCMLCVTGEADILFMPCTHHRTCHECAADLTICPVCNCFIEEKIKTFRA